jgi:molybdenum cofactor cytidylyltransferase
VRHELRREAIVLAAGAGSRFGGGKLIAPWRSGVLLDGALDAALVAPVRRVIVVASTAAVADAAEARAHDGRVEVVRLPDACGGLSASIRAGIAALRPDTERLFLFLGDMPFAPPGVAERLDLAIDSGKLAAAPRAFGRRGHPVLFARALFPALLALDGDRGAGLLLDALGDRLGLVEVDDLGAIYDVDTPAQLVDRPPRSL